MLLARSCILHFAQQNQPWIDRTMRMGKVEFVKCTGPF